MLSIRFADNEPEEMGFNSYSSTDSSVQHNLSLSDQHVAVSLRCCFVIGVEQRYVQKCSLKTPRSTPRLKKLLCAVLLVALFLLPFITRLLALASFHRASIFHHFSFHCC